MLEAFLAVTITLVIVAVVVPLALAYLLVRQIWRSPLVRRITGQPVRTAVRLRAPGSVPAPAPVPVRLGRQWGQLVHDADVARRRFAAAVETFPDGPLRATLADALREVDESVADAQRLAIQGDKADRAHRAVVTALDTQRRRARRSVPPADLEAHIAASTRAQRDSAERLAAAVRRDVCQLQLVVARLHELTAHTLELTALTSGQQQLTAATSIADRLAALRIATDEVERLATA